MNRFPGDLKAVIDANSGIGPAAEAGAIWDDQASIVTDLVQKRRNTIAQLPDDQVKAWQKLVEPIHAAWVKQVTDSGRNGAKLLESARESRGKASSCVSGMPGGSQQEELGLIARISHAAAFFGGCVILAAGGLIVISVISRRLLSASIPGDVELIQAATAIGAFAFLPLGQIHRSTIVVDTFTSRLPEVVCRRIDAFWDLLYSAIVLILAWRLASWRS